MASSVSYATMTKSTSTTLMPGQFWVVEGADGVGKSTQADLLFKRLSSQPSLKGKEIVRWHFPHYAGHPWGDLIKQYLAGELGSGAVVDRHYAGLLYAADRGQQSPAIQATLDSGNWILADRYAPSNMAHQGAHFTDQDEQEAYYRWLEKLEYETFSIVRPTGIILLALDPDAHIERLSSRLQESGENPDILEANLEYQVQVGIQYATLAATHNWLVVNCSPNGRLLDRDEIAEQVWNIIQPHLSPKKK